jgi:hypothetical protein
MYLLTRSLEKDCSNDWINSMSWKEIMGVPCSWDLRRKRMENFFGDISEMFQNWALKNFCTNWKLTSIFWLGSWISVFEKFSVACIHAMCTGNKLRLFWLLWKTVLYGTKAKKIVQSGSGGVVHTVSVYAFGTEDRCFESLTGCIASGILYIAVQLFVNLFALLLCIWGK